MLCQLTCVVDCIMNNLVRLVAELYNPINDICPLSYVATGIATPPKLLFINAGGLLLLDIQFFAAHLTCPLSWPLPIRFALFFKVKNYKMLLLPTPTITLSAATVYTLSTTSPVADCYPACDVCFHHWTQPSAMAILVTAVLAPIRLWFMTWRVGTCIPILITACH